MVEMYENAELNEGLSGSVLKPGVRFGDRPETLSGVLIRRLPLCCLQLKKIS